MLPPKRFPAHIRHRTIPPSRATTGLSQQTRKSGYTSPDAYRSSNASGGALRRSTYIRGALGLFMHYNHEKTIIRESQTTSSNLVQKWAGKKPTFTLEDAWDGCSVTTTAAPREVNHEINSTWACGRSVVVERKADQEYRASSRPDSNTKCTG